MSLEYSLHSKEKLVVVSLKGPFDATTGPVLQKCLSEVVSGTPNGAVIHLGEVADFPKGAHREFFLFFKELKAKCKHVKISGLPPDTVSAFIQRGLLSKAEASETLTDAVKAVALLIR